MLLAMRKYRTLKCFASFQCLKDKCEQNCCGGWKINVDEKTIQKWKERAPHLLDLVEEDKSEGEDCWKMKRPEGHCMALRDGFCGVQQDYGVDMLPDLCGYFPHQYKDFGEYTYGSIALSCPATAKAILFANKEDDWKFVDWKPFFEKDHIYSYKDSVSVPYKDVEKLFENVCALFDNKKEDFNILLATFVKVCFENYKLSTKEFAENLKNEFLKYKTAIKKEYRSRKGEVSDVFFTIVKTIIDIKSGIQEMADVKRALGIFQAENETVDLTRLGTLMTKYNSVIANYKKNTKPLVDNLVKNYFKCRLAEYLFPSYWILQGIRSTLTYILCETLTFKLFLLCLAPKKKDLRNINKVIHIASRIGRLFYGKLSSTTYEEIKKNYWFHRETLNDFILYY